MSRLPDDRFWVVFDGSDAGIIHHATYPAALEEARKNASIFDHAPWYVLEVVIGVSKAKHLNKPFVERRYRAPSGPNDPVDDDLPY